MPTKPEQAAYRKCAEGLIGIWEASKKIKSPWLIGELQVEKPDAH